MELSAVQVLEIARNDLRLFFSSRGNLISLLLVPVVMTLVVGIFSGGNGEAPSIRVDLLDHDDGPLSARLVEGLHQANSVLLLCPMDDDVEDPCQLGETSRLDLDTALARLERETTDGAVVVPAGFAAQVQASEPVTVVLYTRETVGMPGAIEQALRAALQRINGAAVAARIGSQALAGVEPLSANRQDVERALYARAAAIWAGEPVQVSFAYADAPRSGAGGSALQEGLGQSVPGMGTVFVMFTVFGGMSALITERKQWTLQRVAVAPLSRAQILGAKILARFALGMLQFVVVLTVGFVAGIQLGQDPLALVLVAVSYTLAITALSFALGTWLENEAQANGFSLLLSLVLGPLGGAWWPLEVVPPFMRVIGHLSPVAWAMDGFRALTFNRGTLSDVLMPILVLLGVAIASFALGIARFRAER
jgi:ABC-2 type transport system permease protein